MDYLEKAIIYLRAQEIKKKEVIKYYESNYAIFEEHEQLLIFERKNSFLLKEVESICELGLYIQYKSNTLDSIIIIGQNPPNFKINGIFYSVDEMRFFTSNKISIDSIKKIHNIKKVFGGTINL